MKYEKILNTTWEFLENNYKGSEITFPMWVFLVYKMCDTKYCLKQCLKLLWSQWEWLDKEDREYHKNWLKYNFNVVVK